MLAAYHSIDKIEVGLDEVGRGCLAGPVVAAAVILPKDFSHPLLTDSKKLNENQRFSIEEDIKKAALDYAIAEINHKKIDEINILKASFLAMHHALDKLKITPELLLIDGNRFYKYQEIPHICIVKGDSKMLSIAAASVLAKNYRDRLMQNLHDQFPHYQWNKNVGYPTKKHRDGIRAFGTSPYHRMSFKLLPSQLEIFNND